MMEKPLEIRWHGRAGQGVVTAGELLAEAAMHEGKYFQAFPDYGAERMGAPVKSYTRLSDQPIEVHSQIEEPDVVVVVNPGLLRVVDVAEGLVEGGTIVVNTPLSPAEVRKLLKLAGRTARVWTVDATRIGKETLRRDIPSTIMLGALVRATGVVRLETLIELVREKLGEKLQEHVVAANIAGLQRAYEEAVEG